MVGRGAYGRPWLLGQVMADLAGTPGHDPSMDEQLAVILEQYDAMQSLYGSVTGANLARKHIGWYVRDLPGGEEFRQRMNLLESTEAQLLAVDQFFESQRQWGERLQYRPALPAVDAIAA